jgi:hypothetical protein
MRRHAWDLATAAAVALALAAWRTGFHLVPASGGAWRGLSDPPDPGHLLLALLAATLLVWSLRNRPPSARRPLAWMALAALPLVPVLTGRLHLGLAFQGPMLTMLATAVLSVALVRSFDLGRWREPSAWALLLAGFAFYAALGTRLPGRAGPQGDEPHYLTITQSLASDGDLDLKDEFDGREYASFYAGTLTPHASPASPAGRLYSIHTPGLPVLVLPAYLLGGYPGVRLFLSLLAAAAAALVFRLVRDSLGSAKLAWAAWLVVAFAPPLPFFAVALYPETPATLATAAFLWLSQRRPSPARALLGTVTACSLPWIHPKLLPLALVGLVLTLLPSRSPRLWVPSLAALAGSVAMLLLFFHATYGRASLSAAYGPGFSSDVSVARIPSGSLALLLDRQFGLLSVAPVWALALPGLGLLWRLRKADALRALLLAGATFGVGASFSMWWGGSCPPARFVVPCLPALALALAAALPRRRELSAALFGASLAVVAWAAAAPRAIHNHANGQSGLLRLLSPDLDLDALLPSFVLEETGAALLALSLLAAIALTWLLGARGLAIGAASYLALAGGLRERPWVDQRLATLRLLEAWDGDNLIGPSGPPALPRLSIPLDLRSAPWLLGAGDSQRSRRLDLPPGHYRVYPEGEVFDLEQNRTAARLAFSSHDLTLGVHRLLAGRTGSWSFDLLLPVGARRTLLQAWGLQGQLRLDGVRLVPQALVPRRARGDLSWPRPLSSAGYRLGRGAIRTTALDGSSPEGDGFRIEGDGGHFVVDVPRGNDVQLHLERPDPTLADSLSWGSRQIDLRVAPVQVSWTLDPARGVDLGSHWVVPVRIRASGAWIAFTQP